MDNGKLAAQLEDIAKDYAGTRLASIITQAATALRTIPAERDALAKRVGDMRVQGQREGERAVLCWLRERSACKPPASLWHAAEQLADQYEATQRPARATLKGTDHG